MLEYFDQKELERIQAFDGHSAFEMIISYIDRNFHKIASVSLSLEGAECHRHQGGALALRELKENLRDARKVYEQKIDKLKHVSLPPGERHQRPGVI